MPARVGRRPTARTDPPPLEAEPSGDRLVTERLRAKAFTLIEVLVVAAIIVLLLAIVLPAVNGVRTQAKRTACLANLRSIAQSSQAYAFEDRRRYTRPSRCPSCRGERITWPELRIR